MTDKTTVVNLSSERYDVYIGRFSPAKSLEQSVWANPFRIGPDGSRDQVIALYAQYIQNNPEQMARIPELRGKGLGCWCKPKACHEDILTRLTDGLSLGPARERWLQGTLFGRAST